MNPVADRARAVVVAVDDDPGSWAKAQTLHAQGPKLIIELANEVDRLQDLAERDAHELGRAWAVLAVLPAALPSEDEAARAIARASDVEWDYNPEDPEDTYRRDARAVLALIPPQRCAPSEDELAKAVTSGWVEGFDEFGKYGPQFDSALAARAVLALFEGVGR